MRARLADGGDRTPRRLTPSPDGFGRPRARAVLVADAVRRGGGSVLPAAAAVVAAIAVGVRDAAAAIAVGVRGGKPAAAAAAAAVATAAGGAARTSLMSASSSSEASTSPSPVVPTSPAVAAAAAGSFMADLPPDLERSPRNGDMGARAAARAGDRPRVTASGPGAAAAAAAAAAGDAPRVWCATPTIISWSVKWALTSFWRSSRPPQRLRLMRSSSQRSWRSFSPRTSAAAISRASFTDSAAAGLAAAAAFSLAFFRGIIAGLAAAAAFSLLFFGGITSAGVTFERGRRRQPRVEQKEAPLELHARTPGSSADDRACNWEHAGTMSTAAWL